MECHSCKPPHKPIKITACVVAILVYTSFLTDQVVVIEVAAVRLKSI